MLTAGIFLGSSIIFTIFYPSSQETLSCGNASTGFQVSLEPLRPEPSSSDGATLSASNPPWPSSDGVATFSTTKYAFAHFEQLFPLALNVCALTNQTPRFSPLDFPSKLVITQCDDCSKCLDQLAVIHRVLTQIAIDSRLQSLLVIVGKGPENKNKYLDVRNYQNTITKFMFMDIDSSKPFSNSLCEISDVMDNDALKNFSKTSVLFVSISFIILMVISLAWLIFYYIQRFRYAHAKDRLQRRLFNAAKKALAGIPTRPVKAGDKELDSDCPVCIDPYRPGDICRQLPCSCIDPWLLDHRTCPMCKSDILKAFGYQVSMRNRNRTQFSGDDEETGSGTHRSIDVQSSASESNPFSFSVVNETHDPFRFNSSTSPHLVQVMQIGDPTKDTTLACQRSIKQVPLYKIETVDTAIQPGVIKTKPNRHRANGSRARGRSMSVQSNGNQDNLKLFVPCTSHMINAPIECNVSKSAAAYDSSKENYMTNNGNTSALSIGTMAPVKRNDLIEKEQGMPTELFQTPNSVDFILCQGQRQRLSDASEFFSSLQHRDGLRRSISLQRPHTYRKIRTLTPQTH